MNWDKNERMYNPLQPLNRKLLQAMLRTPRYFVREYYPRGREENSPALPLLFTHYTQSDIDTQRAHRHYKLIARDPYRFLYDSRDADHVKRLQLAAAQPEGYRIFVNLVPKAWEAPRHLRDQVFTYMRANQPAWTNGRLDITLQDLFGKLYLIFSWQGNKVEVLLEEVEKYSLHVL